MFSVRIVTTDHYQATPIPGLDVQYDDFRSSVVKKVPVIRVYGSTPSGQKTCMHVHGVFPYLYVPYDGSAPWDRYLRLFANSLDKAINVAQGHAAADIQHVYKIILVAAVPMYGYHEKELQFLKIYFYNPNILRKAADLLLGGAVMNKGFQPHESHIPYTLQMFIDYNLYGMNMLNVSAVKFRHKTEDVNANPVTGDQTGSGKSNISSSTSPNTTLQEWNRSMSFLHSQQVWDTTTIASDQYLSSDVKRQSTCELEVDVVAADILNRMEVDVNVGKNPGLAALWEDEKQRKRNLGQSSQISTTDSQDRTSVETSDTDKMLTERFQEIVSTQRPYFDSQSDTMSRLFCSDSQSDTMSETSDDIPPTPASNIDLHLSQNEDVIPDSQDTVIVEEEEEEGERKAIINVDSIHKIVSMSQSFCEVSTSQKSDEPQNNSLAALLASLADDNSPPASQAAASQVSILEEKDSILLEKAVFPDEEAVEGDDAETMEMSQVVWEDDSQREDTEENPDEQNYDLAGLDSTWNDSQLVVSDDEEIKIPQFDGACDEKSEKPKAVKKGRKKRLGTTGPVIAGYEDGPNPAYSNQNFHAYGNQQKQMYGQGDNSFQQNFQSQNSSNNYVGYGYMNNQWDSQGNIHFNQSNNQSQFTDMSAWEQQCSGWASDLVNSPNGNSHHSLISQQKNFKNDILASSKRNISSPSLQSPQGNNHHLLQSSGNVRLHSQQSSDTVQLHSQQLSDNVQLHSQQLSDNVQLHSQQSSRNVQLHSQQLSDSVQLHSQQLPDNVQLHPRSQMGNSNYVNQFQSNNSTNNVENSQHLLQSSLENSQNSFTAHSVPGNYQHLPQKNNNENLPNIMHLSEGNPLNPQQTSQGNSNNMTGNLQEGKQIVYRNPQHSLSLSKGNSQENLNLQYSLPLPKGNPQRNINLQYSLPSPQGNSQGTVSSQNSMHSVQGHPQINLQSPNGGLNLPLSPHENLTSPTDTNLPSLVVSTQSATARNDFQKLPDINDSFSALMNNDNLSSDLWDFSEFGSFGNMNQPEDPTYQSSHPYQTHTFYSQEHMTPSLSNSQTSADSSQYVFSDSQQFLNTHGGHHNTQTGNQKSFQDYNNQTINTLNQRFSSQTVLSQQELSCQSPRNSSHFDSVSQNSSTLLEEMSARQMLNLNSNIMKHRESLSGGNVLQSDGSRDSFEKSENNQLSSSGKVSVSNQSKTLEDSQYHGSQLSSQGHSYDPSEMCSSQGSRMNSVNYFCSTPNHFQGQYINDQYNNHPGMYGQNFSLQNTQSCGAIFNNQVTPVKRPKGRPRKKSLKDPSTSTPKKQTEKKTKRTKEETSSKVPLQAPSSLGTVWERSRMLTNKFPEAVKDGNLLEKLLLANDDDDLLNRSIRHNHSTGSQGSEKLNMSGFAYNSSSSISSISSLSPTADNKSNDKCDIIESPGVQIQPSPSTVVLDQMQRGSSLPSKSPTELFSNAVISSGEIQSQSAPPFQNRYLSPFREKTPEDVKWPVGCHKNINSLFNLQSLVSTVSHKTRYGVDVRQIATDGKPYQCTDSELQLYIDRTLDGRETSNIDPTSVSVEFPMKKPSKLSELIMSKTLMSKEQGQMKTPTIPKDRFEFPNIPKNRTELNKYVKRKTGHRPSLVRSFSLPLPVPSAAVPQKKRRGRPPKNIVSNIPMRSTRSEYTFSFHVPTSVYKRLKFIHDNHVDNSSNIRVVRMHPMDARRYSLLKIGREVVRIPKLSPHHILIAKAGQVSELELALKKRCPTWFTKDRKRLSFSSLPNRQEIQEQIAKSRNATKLIVEEQKLCSEVMGVDNPSNQSNCIEKITLASIIDSVFQSSIDDDEEELLKDNSTENQDQTDPVKHSEQKELRDSQEEPCSDFISQDTGGAGLHMNSAENSQSVQEFSSNAKKKKQKKVIKLNSERIGIKKPKPSLSTGYTPSNPASQFQDQFFKYLQQATDMPVPVDERYSPKKCRLGQSKLKLSRNKIFRRKKIKLHKKLPLVVDPDQDEVKDVILKDVSLNEASNGTNTPVQSRTPVSGRSPICHQVAGEQYHLFDTDVLDSGLKGSDTDTDMSVCSEKRHTIPAKSEETVIENECEDGKGLSIDDQTGSSDASDNTQNKKKDFLNSENKERATLNCKYEDDVQVKNESKIIPPKQENEVIVSSKEGCEDLVFSRCESEGSVLCFSSGEDTNSTFTQGQRLSSQNEYINSAFLQRDSTNSQSLDNDTANSYSGDNISTHSKTKDIHIIALENEIIPSDSQENASTSVNSQTMQDEQNQIIIHKNHSDSSLNECSTSTDSHDNGNNSSDFNLKTDIHNSHLQIKTTYGQTRRSDDDKEKIHMHVLTENSKKFENAVPKLPNISVQGNPVEICEKITSSDDCVFSSLKRQNALKQSKGMQNSSDTLDSVQDISKSVLNITDTRNSEVPVEVSLSCEKQKMQVSENMEKNPLKCTGSPLKNIVPFSESSVNPTSYDRFTRSRSCSIESDVVLVSSESSSTSSFTDFGGKRQNCKETFKTSFESQMERKNSVNQRKRKDRKQRNISGVERLVTGKFKGHKKMSVQLQKLNISNGTVVRLSDVFCIQQLLNTNGKNYGEFSIHLSKKEGHNGLFCDKISENFQSLSDPKILGNLVTDDSSKDSTCFQPRKSRLSLPKRRKQQGDDVVEISSSDESNSGNYEYAQMKGQEQEESIILSDEDVMGSDEMQESECATKSRHVKRKKISKSQRILQAFTGLSYKARKKRTRSHSGKLMSSLSVLHEATIANLGDSIATYSETTDDYCTKYDDALYKMSLFSPPPPEELEKSPPRPVTPSELIFIDGLPERNNVFTALHKAYLSDEESRSVFSPIKSNKASFIPLEESPVKTQEVYENSSTSSEKIVNSSCDVEASVQFENTKQKSHIVEKTENVSGKNILETMCDDTFVAKLKCDEEDNLINSTKPVLKRCKIGPLHFKQRAIVRLKPLSQKDIARYCSGGVYFGKENVPLRGDISPPDLGPPFIPKYGKCAKDDSTSPPHLFPNSNATTTVKPRKNSSHKISVNLKSKKKSESKKSKMSVISKVYNNLPSSHKSSSKLLGVVPRSKSLTVKSNDCTAKGGESATSVCSHATETSDDSGKLHKSSGDSTNSSKQAREIHQKAGKNSHNGRKQKPSSQGSPGDEKKETQPPSPSKHRVFTPKNHPPTRLAVNSTAKQYSLRTVINKDAYCSKADDLPDKPREVGGRVLLLQSNRIGTLQEFTTTVGQKGLEKCRNILMASDQMFVSQTENCAFMETITKDDGIRFVLLGDRSVTMTPCRLPPASTVVKQWLEKKKAYRKTKEMKKQNFHISKSETELTKTSLIPFDKSDDAQITGIIGYPENVEFNQGQNHLVKDLSFIEETPSCKTNSEIQDGEEKASQGNFDNKTDNDSDEDVVNPSPPQIQSIGSDYLGKSLSKRLKFSQISPISVTKERSGSNHSTPVTSKNCTLFTVNVTPISEESKRTDGKSGVFVTPKRKPLPSRQSSEVSSSRRSLLSSSEMEQMATPVTQKGSVSQIDGPTPKNSFGFKVSQHNLQEAKALHEVQNLTVLSLELHAETRRDLRPDPEIDPIVAVFYTILNDIRGDEGKKQFTGVIIVDKKSKDSQTALKLKGRLAPQSCTAHDIGSSSPSSPQPSTSKDISSPQPSTSKDYVYRQTGKRSRSSSPSQRQSKKVKSDSTDIEDALLQKSGVDDNLTVEYVENEEELFNAVLCLFTKWDPDILVGFDVQSFSWGYLLQRASHLSINLCAMISRIPDEKKKSSFKSESDEWGADHSSEIHIAGRIVLNLWRILRHEVTLNIYTFENLAHHVIHQRVPHFTFQTLTSWYRHRTHLYRWRFIKYYMTRTQGNIQLMNQLDLIGRTSEFARVFGIEFYHVLSRGSQYRVESMMLRLAKPMNFIPCSPSVQQRARMRAPECIPLTLEPESRFYADPVIVLDFQSLYPSIMIAHNYCFSTCVGRLDFLEKAHEGPIEFGCTHLKISPSTLNRIKDDVTVSPNGVVFVKEHIRKGIISKMVEEILNTRIMVKRSMKEHKSDKGLHRLLDARQMGLKLIANVTYGYTGANYSGRMPCIEVGDSIVRKARETLERAIKLVEDTPQWGARVVYGDTDSMFIEMKGASKEEAFKIGYEICDAVTALNPKPIKLKFEKVYYPCVLQTKKRYVGYSYETLDQKEPVFDAKGIETVRRDSCSAVSKILERSIKILFGCKDVSQVKDYVLKQCKKFMEGKVSMQDCVFAKEYRGMKGYKPGACVPALEIARKLLKHDRRSEPHTGERVPYVIVYGSPGLPLIQLVRQPQEVLADPTLRLNAVYYITKQILPPLDRIFSLLGVDVFSWYNDMPKVVRVVPQTFAAQVQKKGMISQYFSTTNCPVCDKQTNQPICNSCMKFPQTVCLTLCERIRRWEKVYHDLVQICNTCMGAQDENQPCISFDCPIMFRRVLAKQDAQKGIQLRDILHKMIDF